MLLTNCVFFWSKLTKEKYNCRREWDDASVLKKGTVNSQEEKTDPDPEAHITFIR